MIKKIERHWTESVSKVGNGGFRYRSDEDRFRIEGISGESEDEIFEDFERKNNRLRYCNGSYYEFVEEEDKENFKKWKSSLSKSRNFELFYGNGTVD